ncbi:MAG: hypothetical protein FGM34_02295 [Solirubrobacteraceae bacterium]|nr:hypothetical protein [Solirubrobacteraceae bacterium]
MPEAVAPEAVAPAVGRRAPAPSPAPAAAAPRRKPRLVAFDSPAMPKRNPGKPGSYGAGRSRTRSAPA